MNPKAKDNLKPFKKGKDERRNLNGRPKLPDLSEAIAKVLAADKDGVTALDAILMALRAKAAKGDTRAAEILMDRGYGKAKQSMDLTSGGEKLTIVWHESHPDESDNKTK